jgi:hypothetical protein
MIADLDETLRQLLIAEIPIKNGEIEVSFDQPKREWSSRLTRPTVNLFLYDLRENPVLRHHGLEQIANGRPPNNNNAHQKRTPFRVDCFYMLTTWAAEPEDEHRLMTRAMLALFRYPVLPELRLVGGLKHQEFDIQAHCAVHDRLTNPAEVWASLDNEMRPTVPYIVTLALDPWTEITGPIVRTLILRAGQSTSLPQVSKLSDLETEMTFIGGTVRSKAPESAPLPGIEVAIKGSGLFDKTDEMGRFTLGSLPAGEYTLVAWPHEGKPREKKIDVPARDGDYDLEL